MINIAPHWFVITKEEACGFKYADLHAYDLPINSIYYDSFNNLLHIRAVKEFANKTAASLYMKEQRILLTNANLILDPLFIPRGDRKFTRKAGGYERAVRRLQCK